MPVVIKVVNCNGLLFFQTFFQSGEVIKLFYHGPVFGRDFFAAITGDMGSCGSLHSCKTVIFTAAGNLLIIKILKVDPVDHVVDLTDGGYDLIVHFHFCQRIFQLSLMISLLLYDLIYMTKSDQNRKIRRGFFYDKMIIIVFQFF